MAYILSKVGQSFNVPIHIYEADTEEDMNSIYIQDVPMGSKCHIINDDKWYMLNSDGKWKVMSSSGGGGSVQPDWNQNDDTQPDYVKNRPFYTGDPVETVLVEESTVSFTDIGGLYTGAIESTFSPTVGNAYKISWDGTDYESTCVKVGQYTHIGNLSIDGSGPDTGEPFLVLVTDQEIDVTTLDSASYHTISISWTDAPVVKIDKKYLPDEIMTDVESIVASHNTSTDSHSDIRLLISGLTDRLNALADSDDTTLDQLSEVVAYIKSNRSLIEAITTNKVSVADIIDNLTTNVTNKPLSAAQGVALKALIDAITIPEALPNPNALTFTGAVAGSYDGSAPLEVEIPSGGGASGDYIPIPPSAEVGQTIVVKAVDEKGKPTAWEAVTPETWNFVMADGTNVTKKVYVYANE